MARSSASDGAAPIAVIGGTGLSELAGFEVIERRSVETPWGDPSGAVVLGRQAGRTVLFLARHGLPHRIPPHLVNYRANLWALRELGAERVVAVNVVGAINPGHEVADLVIVDQIIDYTWGREHTFFAEQARHIDFTWPYAATLREALIDAGREVGRRGGFTCHGHGVYGATQGPRLETAAEIRRLARDGCDVVGMTGMPEAALAAELDMQYACIAVVVNPAAGIGEGVVDMAALRAAVEQGNRHALSLLEAVLPAL